MQIIKTQAFARAGLVGNPSDGYFGKTMAMSVRNFRAQVVLYPWPTLEILPSKADLVQFESLSDLASDVGRNGYYGALRLVTASLKKFHDYCVENSVELPKQNFSIRYDTDIPRGVGLAGSSAIITATFRALMQFYSIDIPREILPNWVRATEREELRIEGGLQDRVAQVYEGLVYMDFERNKIERDGFGTYENLDTNLLPPLYLAYRTEWAETSDTVHNNLRERWEAGDPLVHETMQEFRALTTRAKDALLAGDHADFGRCIDENFELRRKIMPIHAGHLQMVEAARQCGASAHFSGSGGTIAGTYSSPKIFERLQAVLGQMGCAVIVPKAVE
ncbi:MAG TPA: hypothetical protein VGB77_01070 [Abditibacteriaceae bacterium]|jgi:glucuronokinase